MTRYAANAAPRAYAPEKRDGERARDWHRRCNGPATYAATYAIGGEIHIEIDDRFRDLERTD